MPGRDGDSLDGGRPDGDRLDGDRLGVSRHRPGPGAPFCNTAGNRASGDRDRGAERSLVLGDDTDARLQPDAAQVLATRSGLDRAQDRLLPLKIRTRLRRPCADAEPARSIGNPASNDSIHGRDLPPGRATPRCRPAAVSRPDTRPAPFRCTAEGRARLARLLHRDPRRDCSGVGAPTLRTADGVSPDPPASCDRVAVRLF